VTRPVIDRVDSMIKLKCFSFLVDKLGLKASSIAMISNMVRFWKNLSVRSRIANREEKGFDPLDFDPLDL